MKNKVMAILCVVTVITTAIVISILAAPGASDDPVVSLSYVEQRISQLEKYMNDSLAEVAPGYTPALNNFKVVSVPAGKSLVCGEGTEMILRQGAATIFATAKGGIANATAGFDLPDGTNAPDNSLLIVPLEDGRGLKAKTDLLVMVKGKYVIQ